MLDRMVGHSGPGAARRLDAAPCSAGRALVALLLLLLAAPVLAAPASEPSRALAWERLGSPWQTSHCEAQVTAGRLTITYTVGEEPDEWPHAQCALPTPLDLSGWARLEFEVIARTPRATLPRRSLSFQVGSAHGSQWQQDTLPQPLVPGEWVRESVDLLECPPFVLTTANRLQFFLWNRDFHNAGFQAGEQVVFELRNARLAGRRPSAKRSLFPPQPLQHVLATGSRAQVWTEPADNKVLPEAGLPKQPAKQRGVVPLEAAGNDYVDFQVAVRAKAALRGVSVTVTPPRAGGRGLTPKCVQVRPVGLVKTEKTSGHIRAGWCPDPLLQPGKADVPAGETRAFWVRLYVPASVRKGSYEGAVTVRSGASVLARGKVRLSVYGFALPRETHLPTSFQFSADKDWSGFGRYYPQADFALFRRIWASMAQHRIAPMHLGPSGPPRPADEQSLREFDRYLELARHLGFNHFLSFYWGPPVETEEERQWVRRMTDYYIEKGVLDRTYVYMCQFDEASADRWPEAARYAKALKEADPRLRRMLTVPPAPELYGAVDVWCPLVRDYDPKVAAERRKLGEKVWWYQAVDLKPGLLIDVPGTEHRALVWLSWTQKVDGLLFWCINFWRHDPWETPQMGPGTAGNGDGFLLYPRRPQDPADRFYESVRWEVLRDSMEDYEYFWLLQSRLKAAEQGGRARPAALAQARAALAAVAKVAQDRRTYSLAPEDYAHVRRLVARAIEALPPAR